MPRRARGRPRHPEILTPAEQRVLEEVRRGGTNVEIALRLGLSPETVKTHIASMLSKLDLADRRQLAAWQGDEEHRRLPGFPALPPLLGSIGRPLIWAGVALCGLAGLAALVALLSIFVGTAGDESISTSQCATPATGEEAQLHGFNGPGTYRVGTSLLIIPEGVQLNTFSSFAGRWHGDGATSATDSETWAYHYQVQPGGQQVVIERERRTTTTHDDGAVETTYRVTRTRRDASGEPKFPTGFDCSCPGSDLSPELRVLATVYCHVDGTDFDHPSDLGY